MKKNSLMKKLTVATVGIAILFFGGSYLAQNMVEKQLEAKVTTEQKEEEERIAKEIEESRLWFEEIDNMSVKEYYESIWDSGETSITEFQKINGEAAASIKNKDLTDQQRGELDALYQLYENGDNQILFKNEASDVSGEEHSLELSVADINAIEPDENTATIVTKICQEAGIDPNGKIKDLTLDVIIEINKQITTYVKENNLH